MTPEQAAAWVNSQTACMLMEAKRMEAENLAAVTHDQAPTWQGWDFADLPQRFGVTANQVAELFREANQG